MDSLLRDAAERAIAYRKNIQNRKVAPSIDALENLKDFDVPLPENPVNENEVIELLDKIGSPATFGISGPRYFGFVIGGSLPAAVAANWLSIAWDQNAGLFVGSPVGAFLESVSLKWMLKLLSLPKTCGAAFVTGASMANFTSLAAARHSALERAGWDVEANGLFGAPKINVIVSEESHVTIFKALGLLGLGRNRVIKVPTDSQGRMIASKIPKVKGPVIICAQAGNVNTGAFDPIDEITDIAKEMNAWLHVDGAFGLWAAVSPKKSYLTKGIEKADSWATDAHKWLNVPYDCGLAFVKDENVLRSAMTLTASYLPQKYRREPSQFTPELSRRSRGIEVWAALYSLGKKGLIDLVERTCNYAEMFADGLSAAGFEIINDVVLNQVLVSFGDADTTLRVIDKIQNDGTCWCGGTVWQGKTIMRISISSWATTEEDVKKSLDAMIRCAKKVRGK
jgi:glutamate/tyrosine decarboxylase-like PLP-dependent enzyme